MSTNSTAKRSRASNEQLSQMVDFMLTNPGLAGGKFQKLHGKLECDKKWNELADSLNCLGGCFKRVDQWRMVWKDLKSRTSAKVRDRNKQQALTGNKPINQEPLTEMERRVVAIIGNQYIEGHNSVWENVPENENEQLELENGGEFVLKLSSSPAVNEDFMTPSSTKRTPRRSQKRKHVEDSDAEKEFLQIANKQADAMKMLAEANSASLEVSKAMTEAINVMGEGLKAVAEAFNNFANAVNRL